MKNFAKFIGVFSMLLLLVTQADAANRTANKAADKKAEVIALMEKAVAHFNSVGAEQAYKDFNDKNGGFIQGEIYIVVHDFNMIMINHPTNPKLNGKNLMKLKDADGKLFNQEILLLLETADDGWIRYKWSNPATKKIERKTSYVRIVDDNLIFVIGYYE